MDINFATLAEQPSGVQFATLAEPKSVPTSSGLNFVDDVFTAVQNPSAVLADMRGAGEQAVAGAAQFLGQDYDTDYLDPSKPQPNADLRQWGQELSGEADALQAGVNDFYTPKSRVGRILKGATASAPSAMAGIAASLLGGPVAGYAIGAGLGSATAFGQKFDERIDMGDAPEDAGRAAVIHGGTEGLSEIIGIGAWTKLFKAAKAGAPITAALAREAVTEGLEEVAAGIPQGLEDSWRGKGRDPAGLTGMIEHVKSGDIFQQAIDDFVGGFAMGAVAGTAMVPVQMKYKSMAKEQVGAIDQVIQDAKSNGSTSVELAEGVVITVEELQQKSKDIKEAFGLTTDEIAPETTVDAAGIIEELKQDLSKQAPKITESERGSELGTTVEPAVELAEPTPVERTATPNPTFAAEVLTHIDSPLVSDNIVYTSPSLQQYGNLAEDLLIATDVKAKVAILTRNDLMDNPELASLNSGLGQQLIDHMATDDNKLASIGRVGNKYVVVVNESKLSDKAQLETVVHEAYAHVVGYEKFTSATPEQKLAIEQDFRNFLARAKGATNKAERDQLAAEFFPFNIAKETGSQLDLPYIENLQEGTNVGKEWLANQITKWATTSAQPKTLVEKWFKSVAEAFKKIFSQVQSKRVQAGLPVQSVSDWMNSIFDPSRLTALDNIQNLNDNLVDAEQVVEEIPHTESEEASINTKMRALKMLVTPEELERFTITKATMNPADEAIAKKLRSEISAMTKKGMLSINIEDKKRELKQLEAKYANAQTVSVKMKDGKLIVIKTITSTSRSSARRAAELYKYTAAVATKNLLNPIDVKTKREQYYTKLIAEVYENLQKYSATHGTTIAQSFLDLVGSVAVDETNTEAAELLSAIRSSDIALAKKFATILRTNPESFRRAILVKKRVIDQGTQDIAADQLTINNELEANPPVVTDEVKTFVRKKRSAKTDKATTEPRPPTTVASTEDGANGRLSPSQPPSVAEAELVQQAQQVEPAQAGGINSTSDSTLPVSLEESVRDAAQESIYNFVTNNVKVNQERVVGSVQQKLKLDSREVKEAKAFIAAHWSDLSTGKTIELETIVLPDVVDSIPNDITDEELLAYVQSIDDMTVYHGSSKVIPDVPTMEFADPNGLYGPGIYMTEDIIDTETGHLIVTAGYAGETNPQFKLDINNITSIDAQLKFEQAITNLPLSHMSQMILDNLHNDGDANHYLHDAVITWLTKNGVDVHDYFTFTKPNILPLEIDPKPSEVFDVDKEYTYEEAELIQGNKDGYRNPWLKDKSFKGQVIYDRLAHEEMKPSNKAKANQALIEAGFNFITHKGGGITGGVSHKVWIALKDGLVKSKFDISDMSITPKTPAEKKAAIKAKKLAETLFKEAKKPRKKKVLTEEELQKKEAAKMERRSKREAEARKTLEKLIKLNEIAKTQNLSLHEYLEKNGVSDEDRLKLVALYYRHQGSTFTSTEQIVKLATHLGMYDTVEGDQGLNNFIKMVFPKSTGKLEDVGIRGRDVLLHRLQNLHLMQLGQELDFGNELTLANVRDNAVKEFESLPKWKKTKLLIARFLSTEQAGLQTTPAGSRLVNHLRQIYGAQALYSRNYMTQLDEINRHYSGNESELVRIGQMYRNGEQGTTVYEVKLINLLRHIFTSMAKEMEALGTTVTYKDGSVKPFKFDPNETYFPHIWAKGAFEDKANVAKMIDHLVRSGQAINDKEARKIINNFKNKYNRIKVHKNPNLELAREQDIGGWEENPIKVASHYVDNASKRLGVLRILGPSAEAILVSLARDHFTQSDDPYSLDAAVTAITSVLGSHGSVARDVVAGWGADELQFIAMSTMLMHTAILQPGVASNVIGRIGLLNTMKGFAKVLAPTENGKLARARAYSIGVAERFLAKEIFDNLSETGGVRDRADKLMRARGIVQLDRLARAGTALAGQLFIQEEFAKFLSGSKKSQVLLEHLFIDTKAMKAAYDSGLSVQEYVDMGAFQLSQQTNFATDALSMPQFLRNSQANPWLTLATLFARFSFHQATHLKHMVTKEKGHLFRQLLAQTAIGAPIYILRLLAKGMDPEKELEKNGVFKTWFNMLLSGSGLGLFAEMMINILNGRMDFGGPVASMATQNIGAIGGMARAVAEGDMENKDVNKAIAMLIDAGIYVGTRMLPLPAAMAIATGSTALPAIKRNFLPSTESQGDTSFTGNTP